MKKAGLRFLTLVLIIFTVFYPTLALGNDTTGLTLTKEEKTWLQEHSGQKIIMGITPYAGMEYFYENGVEKGYLQELVNRINQQLGTKIVINTCDWKDMIPGLKEGKIDIIVGANETAVRKTFMAFTEPIRKVPYALFALKDSNINTLGDIDNKTVAFLDGDIVINMMENHYSKLKYNSVYVKSPDEAFSLMKKGVVDAFINSGDELVFELLKNNPDAKLVSEIDIITSDMTLSTRISDKLLAEMLSRVIEDAKQGFIPQILKQAKIQYVRKVISLSPEERYWLERDGTIRAGVAKEYLPFDYLDGTHYKGISGMVVTRFADLIGAKIVPVAGDRNELQKNLFAGSIDTLCMEKTDEGLKNAIYPNAFFTERDMIYGKSDSPEIFDLYGLEGKRVAIGKDSAHKDLLFKNLSKPDILYTNNIEESIKAISEGKADYMIENSVVVKYYTEELGIYNLVSKGSTNSDSYSYIAVNRNKPFIGSLFNKVLPLINIDKEKRDGYQSVPHKKPIARSNGLIFLVGALVLLILVAMPIIYIVFERLLKAKTEKEVLVQKEKLLYTDSLTGLYNKNYFNDKLRAKIDKLPFPQALIILDMNNLKEINDNFGHLAGDISLQTIGEIIKGINITCEAFRFGGDEFMVFLSGEEASKAEYIQDRIDVLCENRMIDFPTGERIYIKIASGCAKRETLDTSFEEVFRDADRRMYADKRYKKADGKNFDSINGGK